MTCSALSAGEPLAGTATTAQRFLMLEHRGRWGRDALEDTPLEAGDSEVAAAFDGRVLLIRRPNRRGSMRSVYYADVTPDGGALYRGRVSSQRDRVDGSLLLVCTHGRRDPCCARLGPVVFDALAEKLGEESVWQSSHQGGHRFAANVLVLPSGVQLGRVAPEAAGEVSAAVAEGRIPLRFYRGRTIDSPREQAADAAVRHALSLDGIRDVRAVGDDGQVVEVAFAKGVARVRVEEVAGPLLPASCGADPKPSTRFVAEIDEIR